MCSRVFIIAINRSILYNIHKGFFVELAVEERGESMNMMNVQIDIPAAMAPFAILEDERGCAIRNAMILYPFIQRGEISHGYAAEILGMHKIDLIELYGGLGLPYLTQSEDEIEEDLNTLKAVRGNSKC